MVERGDANKRRDLAVVGSAEFRQLANKSRSQNNAGTRNALNQRFDMLSLVVGIDVVANLAVEFVDLFFRDADHRGQSLPSGLAGSSAKTVGLLGPALDQLPAAGEQSIEFNLQFRAFFQQPWRGQLGEACQNLRVDSVGFGKNAQAFGQVADLAGIDQSQRQIGVEQCGQELALDAAGGFDDDAGGSQIAEFSGQLLDACGIVGSSPDRGVVGASDVEKIFGDVDAHEKFRRVAGRTREIISHAMDPFLRIRALPSEFRVGRLNRLFGRIDEAAA